MNELITYPVEVSVCIVMFYGLFVLALKNETHFRFNRLFLLFTMVASLLIPLLKISNYPGNSETALRAVLQTVQLGSDNIFIGESNLPQTNFIVIIYFTLVFILSVKLIVGILSVYVLKHRCVIGHKKGQCIAFCNKQIAPFSFFNTIFIHKESVNDAQFDKIMMHETIHIRQFHSVDIIFAEIVCILTWFNPLSWLIKAALKENHEYLADSGVSVQTPDAEGYLRLLIRNVVGLQPEIANNLNKSLISKRIKMMKKPRSGWLSLLKVLPVLPIIIVLLLAFSCKNSSKETDPQNLPVSEKPVKDKEIADKMPEFKGGHEAMTKYMIENVKYPEEAKKNGIQGKVFVSFTVTKTGKLDNIKVIRTASDLLNAEALRVISSMPDWEPGLSKGTAVDVEITVPIMFRLS